jgi:hypothetical protein
MRRLVRATYEDMDEGISLEFRGVMIDGGVEDVEILNAWIGGKSVDVTREFEWEHLDKADGLEWSAS